MITPAAAVEAAKRGLARLGLHTDPDVASALASSKAGAPIFVKRLDAEDRDYYLVPWLGESGITLVVQVDAWRGAISSAAALPKPVPRIVLSPDEAQGAVEGFNRRVIGEPRLVWCPCRESSSPLQPLYQIPIDNGDLFVGVDGSVYPRLTPFGQGG